MQAAQLKKGIRTAVQPQTAPNHSKKSAEQEDEFALRDIEQQFIEKFGTKVAIKGSLESGVIEISYFSKENLHTFRVPIWIVSMKNCRQNNIRTYILEKPLKPAYLSAYSIAEATFCL